MAEYVQIYYRTTFILSANKLIVNCFYTELLLLDTYIYVKTNFLYIIDATLIIDLVPFDTRSTADIIKNIVL